MNNNKLNIALIKFSALGDLAMIEPYIKLLTQKYNLTLVTSKIGYEYYKDIDNLNFILINNKNSILENIVTFFKLYSFDKIIDLQGNDRSKILTFTKKNNLYSNYVKSYFIKNLKCNLIKEKSNFHLYVYSILNEFISDEELVKNNSFKERTPNYIVLNCGSSEKWKSKRLPIEKWSQISEILYNKYKLPFYLTGDSSEVKYLKELSKYIKGEYQILAGKTSLIELKQILKNAYLTISTDSAAMHISSVYGTPTIGLFGATNWLRSAPFGSWSTVVYDKKYFKDNIPLEKNSREVDNKFYENINIEEALEKIDKYL